VLTSTARRVANGVFAIQNTHLPTPDLVDLYDDAPHYQASPRFTTWPKLICTYVYKCATMSNALRSQLFGNSFRRTTTVAEHSHGRALGVRAVSCQAPIPSRCSISWPKSMGGILATLSKLRGFSRGRRATTLQIARRHS
jgi:hypothetical protein